MAESRNLADEVCLINININFNNKRKRGVNMSFSKWLETFLEEKGISDYEFEIEADGATHFVTMGYLYDFLTSLDIAQKRKIKDTLIKIDFLNGDELHYFRYLAKGYMKYYWGE